jgi:hypothetical protein
VATELELKTRHGLSRRELLRRGSIGAAAVWAAPIITTTGARAAAGSPPPCACSGMGSGFFGIFTSTAPPNSGSGSGGTSTGEPDCDQNVSFAPISGLSLSAEGTCGAFDAETCTARADFGDGVLELFGQTITGESIATTITTGGCSCEVVATASLVNIKINDLEPVTLSPDPNTALGPFTGPGGTVSIILNRQFCDGDAHVVQGAFISGVGDGDFDGNTGTLVLAESRVTTPDCPCQV